MDIVTTFSLIVACYAVTGLVLFAVVRHLVGRDETTKVINETAEVSSAAATLEPAHS